MNLDSFTGPGSTPSRRRFWDKITQAVTASQKIQGENVSVEEHKGMGTLINVPSDNRRSTPSTPPDCECFDPSDVVMEKDFVEWFDPDTQPPWPNTWDANDAYSDDIDGGDDPDCVPFEHHRVRIRFVVTGAPTRCTLRWNILNVQFFLVDFSFIFTNNIQETIIEAGDSVVGPFEIDSPGTSGCGTEYINFYNYPSGGTGGCCINLDFCALYFTSDDCANRAGTFGGNCTDCDPGPC